MDFLRRTDVIMSRLSRTAFLLACCTPAGLLLSGCGTSSGPEALAPPPVRPIASPLPPLSEPRLLAVPGEIRPVAGDWMESSDANFRQSERHQNTAPEARVNPYTPVVEPAAPKSSSQRVIAHPQPGPPMPAQSGLYSVEGIQRIKEPAPAATAAPPPAATFVAPTFNGPSFVPPQESTPALQPQLQPQFVAQRQAPVMGPARDRSGFRPVTERINALNHQAVGLANRGALFAAREDLLQSLRIATQSLDAADGTTAHSQALDQGLTALTEAEDFAVHSATASLPMRIEDIVVGHRTPVLHNLNGQEMSPVIALQQYYGYAGERLTFAAGDLPAAADTLFWLGKVHNSLARQSQAADRLQGPQAMVCFRAALSVAPQHYLAANELGVLLARYGQLQDAKALLQQSVTVRPHAEGWQNLAIVHKRLGESQLATLAEQELAAIGGKNMLATNGQKPSVNWLEPKTFAATGGQAQSWEQPTAPVTAQSRPTGVRR